MSVRSKTTNVTRATSAALGRRDWLVRASTGALGWLATRALGCAGEVPAEDLASATEPLAASADASSPDADAGDAGAFVLLYDTYAQALYFDGSYGPFTGIVRATDVAAGVDKTYDFWHGHGGRLHRFTLTAAHFAELKRKRRVTTQTTIVDGHQHALFVDPVDLRWRVPGAQPLPVPV